MGEKKLTPEERAMYERYIAKMAPLDPIAVGTANLPPALQKIVRQTAATPANLGPPRQGPPTDISKVDIFGAPAPGPSPQDMPPEPVTRDFSKLDIMGGGTTAPVVENPPHKDISAGYIAPNPALNPAAQTQAQQEVDAGQAPLVLSGGGGGGFQSAISPETRQIYEGAYQQAAETIPRVEQRSLAAAQEGQDLRHAAYERGVKVIDEQAAQAWGMYHKTEDELRKAQEIYATAKDEADDAIKAVRETKIDFGRWWTKGDTFTNALTAINGALGGFFSVYTGQNPAMDTINRSIDAEIHAQEVNLKTKEGVADTLLRRNLMLAKDLDIARERTRLQLLEISRLAAQKMTMDSGDADMQAKFGELSAEIQNRSDQATAELGLKYAAYRAAAEGRVQGEYGLKFLEEGAKKAQAFVSILDPTTGQPLIEGIAQGGEGDAQKLREKGDLVTDVLARFEAAKELRTRLKGLDSLARNYFTVTESQEYKNLKEQMANLVTDVNVLKGQGAISSGDAGRAANMVTDFTNLATSDEAALKAMDLAQNQVRVGFRRLQANRLNPGSRHRVVDPRTGEVITIARGEADFTHPGPTGRGVQTQPLTSGK